ncbi:TPA: GNAT family N-acetyltransferase [Clostridium perfringens]|uniref:GNAT family N-acetyltransferase n=1 Tax=Clostridium perfringens TaxID=1502 RepID=UPI001009FCD6|nr:GNAT family N-acetyltransferase [Clostridium perfringens]MDG6877133.1 Acetyltransferase (GNAT) family protein [Clostridium perfringens]MDG6886947.1 Acetyltransferase (GNAT) family protein [Clostridium perfringens]MDH5078253.1 Acetyltransferase (GNAT) family protein [Clostridium perfringens]MDK0721504.1 GNAT family N-acetyltransferase [Clostridium perfringens]MDK0768884.1 GNAT family N-acetyltransferase [Clostridium perfringens]
MEFRQAKISDLDQIVEIIELSKKYLKETKVDQWQNGYPAKEDLRRDIESGNSYVLTNKNEIVATTVISLDGESTYNSIFNGEWITNTEYIVMHRVAVHDKYKGKGIFKELIKEAESLALNKGIFSIKIDTHRDNISMQRAVVKNNFKRCGIIYLEDVSERIAFEKVLKSF